MTCHANAKVCKLRGRLDVAYKVSAVLEARVGRDPVFCATRRVYTDDIRSRLSVNVGSAYLRGGPICSRAPFLLLPRGTLSKRI